MNGITIEDLKNVLLDSYLAQREIARLEAELARYKNTVGAPEGDVDEEA